MADKLIDVTWKVTSVLSPNVCSCSCCFSHSSELTERQAAIKSSGLCSEEKLLIMRSDTLEVKIVRRTAVWSYMESQVWVGVWETRRGWQAIKKIFDKDRSLNGRGTKKENGTSPKKKLGY